MVFCQNLGVYTLETWRRAASAERWKREDQGAERRGVLGRGCRPPPLPSRLGDLGERRELPQQGPGRSLGRQRILGIFQGLRILLVETMHYGTNQKFGGGLGKIWGACAPWPQPKTATARPGVEGFISYSKHKIQGLFKDFQGPKFAVFKHQNYR